MRIIFVGVVAILCLALLSGCNTNPPSVLAYSDLPATGDVERGRQLFDQAVDLAPPCSSCHNDTSNASPDLSGFGSRAETQVVAESAREYTFYSITEPGRYIVEGFGNAMYNQYDEKLAPQEIADLIAYLLTL